MAVDALEYEDEEANRYVAVEEILETPERLKNIQILFIGHALWMLYWKESKDLDLEASAVELERPGFADKSVTLYDFRIQFRVRIQSLQGARCASIGAGISVHATPHSAMFGTPAPSTRVADLGVRQGPGS